MKRVFLLLLTVFLLLPGCTGSEESVPPTATVASGSETIPTEPVVEEIPMQQINCTPTPYHDSYLYQFPEYGFCRGLPHA